MNTSCSSKPCQRCLQAGNSVVKNRCRYHTQVSAQAGVIQFSKGELRPSRFFGLPSAVGGGKTGWMQIKKRVRRAYILVTRIKYREFKRNQSHPDSRCQTDNMISGPGEGQGSYCSFRRFTPAKTDCPLG